MKDRIVKACKSLFMSLIKDDMQVYITTTNIICLFMNGENCNIFPSKALKKLKFILEFKNLKTEI